MTNITCGIPQGSVLGSIMFLIYINDIFYSSEKLNFLLFDDGTTVYLQGQDHPVDELIHGSNWIASNKFTLNHTKTNYIISRTPLNQQAPVNITVNNKIINKVNEVFFRNSKRQ